MSFRNSILRAGLDTLHATRAHRALAPLTGGAGVIFTLHRFSHVRTRAEDRFAPNRILEVTPEFLEAAICRVRECGIDIVTLDEARRRIVEGSDRRFAAFTIDDGYRDNLELALPVFEKHGCPFAVYVATGIIDRTAHLWWISLERSIAQADEVEVELDGAARRFSCGTVAEKYAAFNAIYWPLRAMGEEAKLAAASAIAARCGVDPGAMVDEIAMTWDELRSLAASPLATIGTHTVSHPALARLDQSDMERELIDGRARLAEMLGEVPRHIAYPYGDAASAGTREFETTAGLGYETAVTTRKGVIYRAHGEHLTALPRVSLNGDFQELRYVDLFVSGAPFALMRGFRRVDAA